ncbi:MAG: DUF4062 domain-containing protein, partial [Anaerolineae bacterium]
MPIKTVFLSSTSKDLAKHRRAVIEAIESLDDWHCVRMEKFGARDWEADDFCRARVAECDLFVGIVGHLYGSCPKGSEKSYTEREYEAAVAAGKPRLIFIAPEDFPLPAYLIEPDEKRQKQLAFRERVGKERICDVFASPDDLARRVVGAIRNWEREISRKEGPPALVKLFYVPLLPNPHFVGRDEALRDLHNLLLGNPTVGVLPAGLTGPGGVGKTQLAVQYAYAYQNDYPGGVFWFNAAGDMLTELADLAERVGFSDGDGDPYSLEARLRRARRLAEYLRGRTDALLIADNIPDPASLNEEVIGLPGLVLAALGCRILFTTRKRDCPLFPSCTVNVLSEGVALELLFKRSKRKVDEESKEYQSARRICAALGYLPLALEQAGAYLGKFSEVTFAGYYGRILEKGALAVDDAALEIGLRPEDLPTRHDVGVRATFATSFKALAGDREAQLTLQVAGFFPEASLIPRHRLSLASGLSSEALPGHTSPLYRALKKLYDFSLVEEIAEDRIRLHPLVKEFAYSLTPKEKRAEFRAWMAENCARSLTQVIYLEKAAKERGVCDLLEDFIFALNLCPGTAEGAEGAEEIRKRLNEAYRVVDREAHTL